MGYSYSSYSSALTCLRKYKLCYVDKLVPEGPTSADLAFGTAVHSGLYSLLLGEDGVEKFNNTWSTYADPLQYGRFSHEQLHSVGVSFLTKFKDKRAEKYQIEIAEKRLYGKYKGAELEGTPDFVGLFEGLRSVRDFKTSGYNYPEEKGLLSLQLNLYAYLALENGSGPIETLGYDVFNKGTGGLQKPLTWQFSLPVMYSMLDDMVANIAMMEKQQEYAKNMNACLSGAAMTMKCPYFNICHGGI